MQTYSIAGTISKIFPATRNGHVTIMVRPSNCPHEIGAKISPEKAYYIADSAVGDIVAVLGTPVYISTNQGLLLEFLKVAYISKIHSGLLQTNSTDSKHTLAQSSVSLPQAVLESVSFPAV
jgi:hypothetical protein